MVKDLKLAVVVQARYNSTRFRGKILKTINNLSILEILIRRLKKSTLIPQIIVACTTNKDDIKIVKLCKKLRVNYFRGPEKNVLKRYYLTAKKFNLDKIIRITSDCPLIDVKTLNKLIVEFHKSNYDYGSNTLTPTYPDGMDVEIFRFKVLRERFINSNSINEKEHVTSYISSDKKYKKYSLKLNKNYSNLRLTVDTKYDLYIIDKLLKYFKYDISLSLEKIIKLYKNKKSFFEKNYNVKRNKNMNLNLGQKFWIRAKEIIPGGTMLFSKNPDLILPSKWPAYFSKSKGFNLWDLEQNKYSDMFSMGVGTNSLGYCKKEIDDKVIQTVSKGNMTSLNSPDEIFLAEKLISLHTWSEMVRFTRSGGEANSVAIRIARAASQKDNVAICGYHGWHDWYLSSNLSNSKNLNSHLMKNLPIKGVVKKLKNTVYPFKYNDFKKLESLVNNKNIGVIKMEVRRFESPKNNFLKKVRKLADNKKIVLIFDECTSGFRETFGGLHLKYGVIPDIAIFGKALGNGYAINAIIGKRNVMEACNSTFISSTFWTERIGSAAALKTLEIMKKLKSWQYNSKMGKYIKQKWISLSKSEGVPLKVDGLDALPIFNFHTKKNDHLIYKTFLSQEMLKMRILASNVIYLSTAHDKKIIDKYFRYLQPIFKKINYCENERLNINKLLETDRCISGMRDK